VRVIQKFLHALADPYTYNLRRNPEFWFGLIWGLPIPVYSIMLDILLLGWHHRTLPQFFLEHPFHFVFLAHPPLFAIVYGAMGTIRRDLEIHNRDLIARLEEQAITDPLTGLYNRRYILEELDRAIARAERSGEPVALVLFDLDNFKEINDTRGHVAGDQVLRNVALCLRDGLRRGDVLGRYGGDEFLLVAPSDREAATAAADRACEHVKSKSECGISAGVAVRMENGTSALDLINAADRALAEAKKKRVSTRRYVIGPPPPP